MSSITVDPAEVAAFNRLAETWWDSAGPMWPLHRLNGLRRDYLVERLRAFWPELPAEAPLSGIETLDIGCGGGLLSESMARFGARVHGVDVAERNISIARQHAYSQNLDIEYDTATAESLLAEGRRYDLVLNMEVVEHVADLPAFLDACCQLTRPGGIMVISTINRTLASWVAAIVGAEYILRWLPRGTHQWRRFPKPDELEEIIGPHGFAVEDRAGVGVNPLSREFRLHRYLGVNYMLVTRRKA